MFIVLFHMVYLLGKHIFERFQTKKLRRASINVANVPEDFDVPCVKQLIFSPPVYKQRYIKVAEILADTEYHGKLRKIVEFGCSEMNLLSYIKDIAGVEEILFIDTDWKVLEDNKHKPAPLWGEYIFKRSTPLKIEICEGSVTHNDKKLEDTDAVVCIELIEHLHERVLNEVPYNIFGYIMPKVVIITTPNADFNILLHNFSGFRHPDHKFEWTRNEFQNWAQDILKLFPYYSVTFQGIGNNPNGTKEFDACTQMAIFNRRDNYVELLREKGELKRLIGIEGLFKTIVTYDYPYDSSTLEEKRLEKAVYWINYLARKGKGTLKEVQLCSVYCSMDLSPPSMEELRMILEKADWIIEDRENAPEVILVPESSILSDCSVDADQLDIHNDNDSIKNMKNVYNYPCPCVYEGANKEDHNKDWCEEI